MYRPKTGINAAKRNRKRIETYLEEHPGATGMEIAKALNFDKSTVYSHLKKIVAEYDKNGGNNGEANKARD